MNDILMNAILAMDSYNRGYGDVIKLEGNAVGEATVLTTEIDGVTVNFDSAVIRDTETGERLDDNIGFYALAYSYNGETIISYRGTNMEDYGLLGSKPNTLDVWHGWSLGAGQIQSQQGIMAIEFYNAVVDDVYGTGVHGNEESINVSLTGHSLGGGLAGYIGALYDQPAQTFDSMGYYVAAERLYAAAANDLTTYEYIYDLVYGGETPWAPDDSGVTPQHIEGEVLHPSFVPQRPSQAYDLGSVTDELSAVDKHSMSMLVIRLFADVGGDDGGALATDWQTSAQYFWPVMFQEAFAKNIGFNNAAELTTMIAYSAIDEGTLVFGDTGIRALYDDANDFGKAVTNAATTNAIMSFTEELSKVFVQYAGELALHKAANDNALVECMRVA
jgi:hypothetical protein